MKVLKEAWFLETVTSSGDVTFKLAQNTSVPKAYATRSSCMRELNYLHRNNSVKDGRVVKGYMVVEDEPFMSDVIPRSTVAGAPYSEVLAAKTMSYDLFSKEELPF
jgi:hypothetical protein